MSLKSTLRTVITAGKGVTTGLPDAAADRHPIDLFEEWFAAAREAGIYLPEAMTLATCSKAGVPSARMVLLKGVDAHGFVFFTNYGSRKADELIENPRAALVFHWPVLQRQVRVEGTVTKVTEAESADYFGTRPRGSRIGAWASRQSEVLEEREMLEERVRRFEQQFDGDEIPLPPFWGGFRVQPSRIEFWQGRADRLHDRLCFTRNDDGAWTTVRLYP